MAQRLDLTEGSVTKHLVRFAMPMLISNVIQNLYGVADSIWLGQLVGSHALGAVNVSNPILFLVNAFIVGLFTATTVLIAQYTGAQDGEGVGKTINTSLSFGLIAGAVLSIVGVLVSTPILRLISTPDTILKSASDYLRIILSGTLFTFGFNSIGAILRGMGDSRTPMWVVGGAAITNIVLDPIFIADWGLGMGISGAALATILSQALSFFVAAYYLRKKGHALTFSIRKLRIDREIMGKIIRLGLPTSLQQMLLSISFLFVTNLVNRFGEIQVNTNGIIIRLDGFAIMPAFAINAAVSSIVGQNIGAHKPERALEALRWGRYAGMAISAFVGLLLYLFAPALASVFINAADPMRDAIIERVAECLRILSFSYVIFAFMQANNGFISGNGATLFLMTLTVSSQILRLILAYTITPILGYRGIYYAQYVPGIVSGTATLLYILSGRWRKIDLARKERVMLEEAN